MADLLEVQLRAIKVLQDTEESIKEMVKFISLSFSKTPAERALLTASLTELVKTSILYGDVKCTHENLLKDDRNIGENPKKEG